MSGYVGTVIVTTILVGVCTLAFSGFRLSRTFRYVLTLVMTAVSVLPFISLVYGADLEGILDLDLQSFEVSDAVNVYVDRCEKEIELKLKNALILQYGEGILSVDAVLDKSDASAVTITEIRLTLWENYREVERNIKETVTANTACESVNFAYQSRCQNQ